MSESGDLRITSKQYTCFPIQSQRHLHSQTAARKRVAILHPHRHGLFGNGEDEEMWTGKVTVGYSRDPGLRVVQVKNMWGFWILGQSAKSKTATWVTIKKCKKEQNREQPRNPGSNPVLTTTRQFQNRIVCRAARKATADLRINKERCLYELT